jgi:hypothetical protein
VIENRRKDEEAFGPNLVLRSFLLSGLPTQSLAIVQKGPSEFRPGLIVYDTKSASDWLKHGFSFYFSYKDISSQFGGVNSLNTCIRGVKKKEEMRSLRCRR